MCAMRLLRIMLLVLAVPSLAAAAPPGAGGRAGTLDHSSQVIRIGVPGCLVIEDTSRIFFARRSAVITPVSFAILDYLASVLSMRPEIKRVRIEGHTDASEPDGVELSWRRSTAVMLYLLGRGVEPWRLTTAAFGARCPRRPNDTADNRSVNRRADFVILQQEGVMLDPPVCRDPASEKGLVFKEPETTVRDQRRPTS